MGASFASSGESKANLLKLKRKRISLQMFENAMLEVEECEHILVVYNYVFVI